MVLCLAVSESNSTVPSRRTAKRPLRAKVFSYYTDEEHQLLKRAAKLESRSLSSFVALASIEVYPMPLKTFEMVSSGLSLVATHIS